MASIEIIQSKCTGCGGCMKVCPENCISLIATSDEKQVASIDKDKCTYCSACKSLCEGLSQKSDTEMFNAVKIEKEFSESKNISDYKDVWVFAEVLHGELSSTAFELLNIGKRLADDLGENLCAVLMGKNVKQFASELFKKGAKKVFVIERDNLENFLDDVYAKALSDLIIEYKPNKFLLPATVLGRSLSAKAAILADTGLTADATSVEIDKETGLMRVTRPTFGGNLMATIVCKNHRPEMTTLRPLSYEAAENISDAKGEIIEFPFNTAKHISKAEFVSFIKEEAGEIDIASADIIVSGGRGMNNAEGFKLLSDFAHSLGGAVGASRAAVDSGWVAYRHQVGLTGRTVRPKVYIACGISGQVQHMAGMSSADTIIAINKDPDAPMMKQATYALEGDLYKVIPELIKELKK